MALARVLLIDDDLFTRSSLTAALNGAGMTVIASAENGSSGIAAMKSSNPEVAVVDLDLGPGPSGIDICNALRIHNPLIGLVLLTSYTDPRVHDPSNSQLPKGCRFLSKTEMTDIKLLVQEILIARNKPLSVDKNKRSTVNSLTDSQLEVLIAVAHGLSSSEIAANRGVSVKAIEAMIAKIHSILGITKSKSLNQRVQLARSYFQLSGRKPPGA
jgi:DNA-binding NarL/FixJ family response regulator